MEETLSPPSSRTEAMYPGSYLPEISTLSRMEDIAVRLSLKDVGKQSDTAIGETATEGYQMLNLRANKSIQFDSGLVLNLTALVTI